MKITTKVLAATAMLGLAATAAQADTMTINGVSGVGALDWNVGNALSVSNTNVLATVNGTPSTLYYQAALGSLNDAFGAPITGTGLNSTFDITVVAAFGEKASNVGIGSANYVFDSSNTTNYFKVYLNNAITPANAPNPLLGTGYTSGILIMSGVITDSFGNFSDKLNSTGTALATPVNLLSAGEANTDPAAKAYWNGVKSVTGGGHTQADVDVTYLNPLYASVPVGTIQLNLNYDGSNDVPYTTVAPSEFFNGGTINTKAGIGAINGVSGNDFVFQADGSSAVTIVTPEPSTMVLLGAGLFGLSVFARRRKES
jgi:hypothetical protein